jgi:hypothetical protein
MTEEQSEVSKSFTRNTALALPDWLMLVALFITVTTASLRKSRKQFSVGVSLYGFQLCHIVKCRDEIMSKIIFLN